MKGAKLGHQSFSQAFLAESVGLIESIDADEIESLASLLTSIRNRGGRVFFIGSGGGLGHGSHAAADFRNIGGFETYCVGDNASELTALINDHCWEEAYSNSLSNSRLTERDCIFVFSVGGGSVEHRISLNLVNAMRWAKERGATILGVVGRDGGYLREVADASVLIPEGSAHLVTAQVEALQALIWHLLVVHPNVQVSSPKWESMAPKSDSKQLKKS